jgi:hypothetical protein
LNGTAQGELQVFLDRRDASTLWPRWRWSDWCQPGRIRMGV